MSIEKNLIEEETIEKPEHLTVAENKKIKTKENGKKISFGIIDSIKKIYG